MAAKVFNVLRKDDLGKLLIRLSIGGLMLFHGIKKVMEWNATVKGMGGMLESKGLPSAMAYGVFVGEAVAPVLIIIGLFTRAAGAVLAFTMVMAIAMAHRADILARDDMSGGSKIELPLLFLLGGLALVFFGSGKYSVSRGRGGLD